MPLIVCPLCSRATYAYPVYRDDEVVAFRCSNCWNVFNCNQVNVLPFPNVEIVLKSTFREFIAYVDRVEPNKVEESGDDLALRFLRCLQSMVPHEIRFYRNTYGFIEKYYASWDYRGTREADERNEELVECAQMRFASAVGRGYVVVEFREPDEGDSIFVAVHPDDVHAIVETLKRHGFYMLHTVRQ